jgi:hypothetical protein
MIRSVLNTEISRQARWFSFLVLAILFSCKGSKTVDNESGIEQGAIVSYAERFKIERNEDFTKLTVINPWQGA